MTRYIEVAARVLAYQRRQALLVRETSSLTPDPPVILCIAPLRVVSEQRVQAIAYGPPDVEPEFVTSWNPLSRESTCLEPFAETLDAYVTEMLRDGGPPRIWLPHRAALEVIELLGHRYRDNAAASPTLRRMGAVCMALADEASFPGQQVVAVAGDLLVAHVVTGQSPVEDRHLGALLAWIQPVSDPSAEAHSRALIPAAAMLDRAEDDRVEALRKIAKSGGSAGDAARVKIDRILRQASRREWNLLLEARRAFLGLGRPATPRAGELAQESFDRISMAVDRIAPPTSTYRLSRLLDEYEYAHAVADDVDACGDSRVRERMRRQGRVVRTEVVSVLQPVPNRHPCALVLRITQEVGRVRPETQLKTLDGRAVSRVVGIREDRATGGTLLDVELTKGVLRSRCPTPGSTVDWTDTVLVDTRYLRTQAYRAMRDTGSPLVSGNALPPSSPRPIEGDLGVIAEGLKRR